MIELGLFDIMQIDPTDPAGDGAVYQRRLDDLALADELGLRFAFTAERHFMPTYRAAAPTAWLSAASQRTRRLRLGVLAYTLPIHHPAALAEEVAVLDQLTGGRIEVGLGLGHRPEELVALGVDPAQRIQIFQERLAILRALWSGGQVSVTSDHHVLKDIAIHPLAVQEPHPPLWYAGTQPAATSWAGANGMSLAVGFARLRDLVPAMAGFKAGRKALEGAADRQEVYPQSGRIALMRHVYLAESDERARSEMIEDLMVLGGSHQPAGGSRPDRRAEAEAKLDDLLEQEIFIAGSPETVANAIWHAHRALGVGVFLANLYAARIDDVRVRRAIRMLATDVSERLAQRAEETSPASAIPADVASRGTDGS
jgi:alkanesulfonate monooxygenase SsuD/methylene tetrahydromethanopterin reductase-like flavin-dependent oxidoreductase (luciferase family)